MCKTRRTLNAKMHIPRVFIGVCECPTPFAHLPGEPHFRGMAIPASIPVINPLFLSPSGPFAVNPGVCTDAAAIHSGQNDLSCIRGLEPLRLAALPRQRCVSANST